MRCEALGFAYIRHVDANESIACHTLAQMVCNRASAAALNSSQSHAFRFAHTEAIGKDASEHAEAAQQGTYMSCNEAYEQS